MLQKKETLIDCILEINKLLVAGIRDYGQTVAVETNNETTH